jgi:hypothetical protein
MGRHRHARNAAAYNYDVEALFIHGQQSRFSAEAAFANGQPEDYASDLPADPFLSGFIASYASLTILEDL